MYTGLLSGLSGRNVVTPGTLAAIGTTDSTFICLALCDSTMVHCVFSRTRVWPIFSRMVSSNAYRLVCMRGKRTTRARGAVLRLLTFRLVTGCRGSVRYNGMEPTTRGIPFMAVVGVMQVRVVVSYERFVL